MNIKTLTFIFITLMCVVVLIYATLVIGDWQSLYGPLLVLGAIVGVILWWFHLQIHD